MKAPSEIKKSSSDIELIAETRSRDLVDLLIHFAPKQQMNDFYDWFQELQKLNQDYPENKEIQNNFASALKNSIRMFGERKYFADMLNILDELEALYMNTNREKVGEYLAEAISIAVFFLRGSWDTEGTNQLLNRLRLLVKVYPKNNVLIIHYAKSYSNAINRFCSERHNFICDKLLFELRIFSNKYRENEDIQIEFAQALTNVVGTLAREGRMNELTLILDELRKLASRFIRNEKIQLLVTRASILSSLSTKDIE